MYHIPSFDVADAAKGTGYSIAWYGIAGSKYD